MNLDFSSLIHASKKYTCSETDYRLAVLGDSATQLLSKSITGYGVLNGFPIHVLNTDYDQITLQAYDDASALYTFKPQTVLIFMCSQRLYEDFCKYTGDRKNFAVDKMKEIEAVHNKIHNQCGANLLQCTFVVDNDSVFGNFGLKLRDSFVFQVNKLNLMLMEWAADTNFCYLIDMNRIRNLVTDDQFFDPKMYCSSKLAVSMHGLPEMASNVVTVLKALNGIQKKCVIFDLDNTIWGGVIGDDGMDTIELGELGTGRTYSELQMWLKELKRRGILLCVCSKNEESVAKEPFLKHPDMILRLEDITVFMANWEDKATNIQKIRDILNIGMDSMVFLDDNPFERELVREMLPQVSVPELPEDTAQYCRFLKEQNLFETTSYSENDGKRTSQYKAELQRVELKTSFENFNDYLKRLEMVGSVGTFKKYYFSRIAQLTQRSNQFNLRTVRYSEADIQRIAADDRYIPLYFTLKDKFGDQGLVSVVILEKKVDRVFVDTFLMSCRVLKRGMEEFVVNSMVRAAKEANFDTIEAEYIPTQKNKMVQDLYSRFGFKALGNHRYLLHVADYIDRNNFISCAQPEEQERSE